MRHLLDTTDLTVEEIDQIIHLAMDIIENKEKYAHVCDGKKLATLFFEPSTRTRLSFEAAMMELGGNVLGFSEASSSSASKGETVADTAKIVSCYADIIAMRHPREGAPRKAITKSDVPVINAGDGGHSHPTQTMTDLLTIYREKGRLNNLTIGLCGDLKFGRTVHSLVKAMCRYSNIKFVLISPKELAMPDYVKTHCLEENGIEYVEVEYMDDVIADLDILYMTRVQGERFASQEEYMKHRDAFILDLDKLKTAKEDLTIMHPLPRITEITLEVDDDPRAKYFEQALNGKYVRMAIILTLLKWKDEPYTTNIDESKVVVDELKCSNPHCISNFETGKHKFVLADDNETYRCIYCETKAEK